MLAAATIQCCAPIAREPLAEAEAAELATLLKAVGDPVRLRLLSLIGAHAGGEACVCDLTDAFDLTPPTISHHLKVLRAAGLIDGERRGTWVYYRIIPETVNKLGALFAPLAAPAPAGRPVDVELITRMTGLARMADVVVIGAGQAGLATGYHLRRAGLDSVILDAEEAPGGAWQHAWATPRPPRLLPDEVDGRARPIWRPVATGPPWQGSRPTASGTWATSSPSRLCAKPATGGASRRNPCSPGPLPAGWSGPTAAPPPST